MIVDATQFSISGKTKNRLDRYKAENKERIIADMNLKRRLVSNTNAIDDLLNQVSKMKDKKW